MKSFVGGSVGIGGLLWLLLHSCTAFSIISTSRSSFAPSAKHLIYTAPRGGSLHQNNLLPQQQLRTPRTTLHSSVSSDNNNNNDEERQLDWNRIGQQFSLFRQMAGPYYEESSAGRWLLAGLLALTLLNSGVSVLFSYLGKDFWNALSARNTDDFYHVLSQYVPALLVGAPVVTLYRYQREQLAVHWREWMTVRTLELYQRSRVYYSLERQLDDHESDNAKIDNPDQRICEDVNAFTAVSLQLVITVLTSLIDLASFATILWSIYPQLFGAIVAYAGLGTIITAALGRPLVALNFSQLRREADLRYLLVRWRDNAESIAFYGGEDLEGQAVQQRVDAVVDNQRSINAQQRNLEFFVNSYRYLVQILPVAVVAPRYFAGEIALGVISQSVGAFNHILSDLSIVVNQFERLSAFSAGVERLSGFYERMRDVDLARLEDSALLVVANETMTMEANATVDASLTNGNATDATVTMNGHSMVNGGATANKFGRIDLFETISSDVVLELDHLELCTPDQKRLLISDLSVTLQAGENLLIVGNSGTGKSSLLRAIAGLWTVGNGRIGRPSMEDIYFLPQRPYCTLGSLRDQLLYPSLDYEELDQTSEKDRRSAKIVPKAHLLKQKLSDQDLLDVLEQVDLLQVAERAGDGDAVRGLNTVLDWSNRLSLGEQQRLAFGRLLINRPRLVIVDEATSALDMVAEARMYTLLRNMAQKNLQGNTLSAPGLTYISVGHRPSLLAYHDKRLRLNGDEHELTNIEKSKLEFPKEISNL